MESHNVELTKLNDDLVVLPIPQTAPEYGARFAMPYTGTISVDCTRVVIYARQIADDLHELGSLDWEVKGTESFVRLEVDSELADGYYRIEGGEDFGFTIAGGGSEGVRNGVQTFRQILSQTWPMVPEMRMEDGPRFQVRGYMLDVTRGRVPTISWLKHWVDKLCYYKYNQFQLYFEHTFAYPGMSDVWGGSDPVTPEELCEIDQYCAERDIELVPAVASFGHQYVALRTKRLRSLGEFPEDADRPFSFIERQQHHTFNAADPQAFAKACEMVDSVLDSATFAQCNIGGDETFDLGRGQSREVADRIGRANLYANWVTAMTDHIHQRGHKVQLWADIAVEMPQILNKLPQGITLLNWDYSPQVDERRIKMVADSGLTQIVCPAVHAWNALIPRIDLAWNNISNMARLGMQYGAKGMLITDWGDFGHINDPRMALPGLTFGACFTWNPDVDCGNVFRAVSRLEYGDSSGEIVDRMREVDLHDVWNWYDMVRYLELDDGTGKVNQEVLGTIWEFHGKTSPDASLQEVRKAYLRLRFADKTGTALGHLRNSIDDLELSLCEVRGRAGSGANGVDVKDVRLPIQLGMAGTLLLNQIGELLAARSGLCKTNLNPREVAETWAVWSEHYAEIWGDVSRGSELRTLTNYFKMVHRLLMAKDNQQMQAP